MLYFIRHARTAGNIEGVWVGRNDQPVHPSALQELENVALQLSEIEFDVIYTSPLQRAITTAQTIAKYQKKAGIPVVRDELIERDFSKFEGKLKTLKHREELESSNLIEDLASMQKRLEPFVRQQITKPEKILVVSHSAVYRFLTEQMKLVGELGRQRLNNLEWEVYF